MTNLWIVRAGRGSRAIDLFLDRGLAAIGFSDQLGDRPLRTTREELVTLWSAAHPTQSKPKVAAQAGQVYRFLHEVQVGDEVVTYDAGQRRYLLGKVTGDARYDPTIGDFRYVRDVAWSHRVPRSGLSLSARNSLGSIMTIFQPRPEACEELRRLAVALDAPESEEPEQVPQPRTTEDAATAGDAATDLDSLREGVVEKAAEFIEDIIDHLDAYELQELVAGILRAMGYKTRVAEPGPDRGIDIFASPDGLGLQEPRIFVEVKHRRNTAMGSQALRTFLGGRQPGDRCLYVSTGGFTKEAKYEAERANVPLTLIGLPELRELLVEHYEAMDIESKQLVPLKRVYWPVGEG